VGHDVGHDGNLPSVVDPATGLAYAISANQWRVSCNQASGQAGRSFHEGVLSMIDDPRRARHKPISIPICLVLTATAAAVILADCSRSPPVNLAASLQGIEKSKFLSCSGPPLLAEPSAGGEHMSFVTNLRRGETIGNSIPTALPVASCSVDAIFQNDRLVSSLFSGDQSMCSLVFSPCLQK
jgi:hypothetical protein